MFLRKEEPSTRISQVWSPSAGGREVEAVECADGVVGGAVGGAEAREVVFAQEERGGVAGALPAVEVGEAAGLPGDAGEEGVSQAGGPDAVAVALAAGAVSGVEGAAAVVEGRGPLRGAGR
jgi:hypothetical protein